MDDNLDDRSPGYSHQDAPNSSRWNPQTARGEGFTPSSSNQPTFSPSDRPRASRTSSLHQSMREQRASPSIFGSGPSQPPNMEEQTQQHGGAEGPPTLAVSPPSQENLPISQPPLSTLSTEIRKRGSWYEDDDRGVVDRRRIPRVEKDADDPTAAPSLSRSGLHRRESTTLTTLSRLFAVQAPIGSPEHSRSSSYVQPSRPPQSYTRNLLSETAPLPDHLYTRGLMEGRHSDITVRAFGHEYRLHRIILDRAPFFRSALSEPWLESNAKETTVHPQDIDSSITQASFELALKRLYGCANVDEEDGDAVGLFATGCWLEMQDLIESSVESMLRQMSPETLAPLIKLVTSNYYGRSGDKILASAKAMLCRDGWRMPIKHWDGIPGDIIREIVGGDGFFIDGEWERWVLAKRILDRRLRSKAVEAGMVEPGTTRKVQKAPDTTHLMAVRFDALYRRNSIGGARGLPDRFHRWTSMYTHPDIEPILVLLDEGIHYIHLDFEQLQLIKDATDAFGLPVLSQKVIGDALWQQMQLRQRVVNAREGEMELGVSVRCTEDVVIGSSAKDTTMSIMSPASPSPASPNKGKHRAEDVEEAVDEGMESGSWDGNGKPRKFWIPSSDCNIVMGGNADPIVATSNNTTLQRHASRLSATIQPEDVQWASDFSAVTSQPRVPPQSSPDSGVNGDGNGNTPMNDVRYTHFPPFRFAAEFPNPRLLKEKKRVYSRTVFYAGSLWNIYIQKVASSRSKQLGVYLHRAKERETEEVIAGTAGLAQGSVDERIGMLEREMLMRSERRERRQQRRRALGVDGFPLNDPNDSDDNEIDQETTLVGVGSGGEPSSSRPSLMRDLLTRSTSRRTTNPEAAPVITSSSHDSSASNSKLGGGTHTPDSDSLSSPSNSDSETERLLAASKRFHVPTIPPYVDARPTIKTYFKIYSPSRGGRMLSVYESAPDRFNFSQSWGWKSSTLMLDEGLLGEDDDMEGTLKGRGDGRLRFMVVIGNI